MHCGVFLGVICAGFVFFINIRIKTLKLPPQKTGIGITETDNLIDLNLNAKAERLNII